MLAIAAMAAIRASTIATMIRGERLSVEVLLLATSVFTAVRSVWTVPSAV